jgi:hypothetical protein
MNITERMKKYAELYSEELGRITDQFKSEAPSMYTDLQTAMRALQVAKDTVKFYAEADKYAMDMDDAKLARHTLKTINELLGEK